jgi:hypothetical protein
MMMCDRSRSKKVASKQWGKAQVGMRKDKHFVFQMRKRLRTHQAMITGGNGKRLVVFYE